MGTTSNLLLVVAIPFAIAACARLDPPAPPARVAAAPEAVGVASPMEPDDDALATPREWGSTADDAFPGDYFAGNVFDDFTDALDEAPARKVLRGLTFIALDAEDRPLAEARFWIEGRTDAGEWLSLNGVVHWKPRATDVRGRVELTTGLAPRVFRVYFQHREQVCDPVVVDLTRDPVERVVRVRARPLVAIHGRVIDAEGRPRPAMTVTGTIGSFRSVVVTDAKGRYRIPAFLPSAVERCEVAIEARDPATNRCATDRIALGADRNVFVPAFRLP
jgi:hypothetical protein